MATVILPAADQEKNHQNPRYWDSRKEMRYYRRVIELAHLYFKGAGSVIDIGSCNTEILRELSWIPRRVALDHDILPNIGDIEKIKADFMQYAPGKAFHAALCLQTLEHVKEPRAFAEAVFACSDVAIFSLPYKWPSMPEVGHLHDDLDETAIRNLIGRDADYSEVVDEGTGKPTARRIILVYKNAKGNAPVMPAALPGELWGVACYFNPARFRNKYSNYQVFRNKSHAQGLRLLAVELAFDDDPFVLEEGADAEILVQIRGSRADNLMWQKERLLSIGVGKLPASCDKVALLDADISFDNDRWVAETSRMLESYAAVQPFAYRVRLPRNGDESAVKPGIGDASILHGLAYGVTRKGADVLSENIESYGDPGFGWSFRRSFFEKVGIFDSAIIDGGDKIMAFGLFGRTPDTAALFSEVLRRQAAAWTERCFKAVRGSVSYASGTVRHFWHGDLKHRDYLVRHRMLAEAKFDPTQDLVLAKNELWALAPRRRGLARRLARYFWWRNEDGSGLRSVLKRVRDAVMRRSLPPVPGELPVTMIGPDMPGRGTLVDLWRHRSVFRALFWRDLRVRYRQTIVGFLWVILQPILMTLVISVVFATSLGARAPLPYAFTVFAGFMFWNVFSSTVTNASASIVANKSLVQRTNLPRALLPLSLMAGYLLDFCFASLVFVGLLIYYHISPPAVFFLVAPVALAIVFLSSVGVGMFLAAVNVFYRDIRLIVPFLVQLLLFTTPVIYTQSRHAMLERIWVWNPVAGAIDAVQTSLVTRSMAEWNHLVAALALACVLAIAGWNYFKAKERHFADVI